MEREKFQAGNKVPKGVYQCNACANEHETREDMEKLPLCCVCDSSSWKARRLAPGASFREEK